MKITKYPESCLIIEHSGKRICIDPGSFVAEKYSAADLQPLDAILITHEHPDHVVPGLLGELSQNGKVPVFGNQSTKNLIGELITNIVNDLDEFEAGGVKIVARELPHSLLPDGSPGPQNTGYIIDGTFFHPGDGFSLDGLQINAAAIPIAGPDISPKDAFAFIKQLGCKTVIPVHYDFFFENPHVLAEFAPEVIPGVNFAVLDDGQSIEI